MISSKNAPTFIQTDHQCRWSTICMLCVTRRATSAYICDSRMGWHFNMGLQPYTPAYKRQRKLFEHGFSSRSSEEYMPIQTVRDPDVNLGDMSLIFMDVREKLPAS